MNHEYNWEVVCLRLAASYESDFTESQILRWVNHPLQSLGNRSIYQKGSYKMTNRNGMLSFLSCSVPSTGTLPCYVSPTAHSTFTIRPNHCYQRACWFTISSSASAVGHQCRRVIIRYSVSAWSAGVDFLRLQMHAGNACRYWLSFCSISGGYRLKCICTTGL